MTEGCKVTANLLRSSSGYNKKFQHHFSSQKLAIFEDLLKSRNKQNLSLFHFYRCQRLNFQDFSRWQFSSLQWSLALLQFLWYLVSVDLVYSDQNSYGRVELGVINFSTVHVPYKWINKFLRHVQDLEKQ